MSGCRDDVADGLTRLLDDDLPRGARRSARPVRTRCAANAGPGAAQRARQFPIDSVRPPLPVAPRVARPSTGSTGCGRSTFSRCRDAAGERRAMARRGTTMPSVPSSAARRSAMFCRPDPFGVAGSKPCPSSVTTKVTWRSPPSSRRTTDSGVRVLRDVLQCLEATEIDRRLDLLRVPVDVLGVDLDRDRGLGGLGPEGGTRPSSASSGGYIHARGRAGWRARRTASSRSASSSTRASLRIVGDHVLGQREA